MAKAVFTFLVLILLFPLFSRARKGFNITRQACINIYEQQYQMGRFLQQYYFNERVASGDIGAISFFTAGNILDFEGLGTTEVLHARRDRQWGPAFLDWMCRKDSISLAIVFDKSYSSILRDKWKKVATWRIPNNVICYSDVVSFYAVDSTAVPSLAKNLHLYEHKLPKEVEVEYYYAIPPHLHCSRTD